MKSNSFRNIARWLGLAVILFLAWTVVSARRKAPIPLTASPRVNSVVAANTAFALDLYKQFKEQPGNLFFSPYSISLALGMTYAGARGTTESEMATTLHFALPQAEVHAAFGELLARTERIQRGNRITLTIANSLWCQQGYPLMEAFLDLTRKRYKAEVQLVDFKHAASSGSRMNAWVEQKTHGKINGLIDPAQLTPDVALVLCNAIYFKGKWAIQFKPGDTTPAEFFVGKDQTVTVPMMYQKSESEFKTASVAGGFERLELPYSGRDLSMVVLLPAPSRVWPELERNSRRRNFVNGWRASMPPRHTKRRSASPASPPGGDMTLRKFCRRWACRRSSASRTRICPAWTLKICCMSRMRSMRHPSK